MQEVAIQLAADSTGDVIASGAANGSSWTHTVAATEVAAVRSAVDRLLDGFESGRRPLADPVELVRLGALLRETYLAPLAVDGSRPLEQSDGRLLFASSSSACLNLPWELLPGREGRFLVSDGRWAIRRTVRADLPETSLPLAPRPLRILFTACAPQHTGLPVLDYEREEEAILRIADRLGGKISLDIAEAGTFDELRDLISELHPHVVHLSGDGMLHDGVGRFCFEDERGRLDARGGPEMAECLFAGSSVRLVFVSGCQSAQAGVAGLCQSLTAAAHVPLAIGWGASIADDRATEFARDLFHELAAGNGVDRAVATARRNLLAQGRVRIGDRDALDASFALPQVYAAAPIDRLPDESQPPQRPERPGVRYELLGDDIRGLRSGFVGRRRALQRTRPALRSGEKTVVLLTGIGGAGKSTLATRLANRCKQDGYRIVALQARCDEAGLFTLRLLDELATACQRLERPGDEQMLRDGRRPTADCGAPAAGGGGAERSPHPAGAGQPGIPDAAATCSARLARSRLRSSLPRIDDATNGPGPCHPDLPLPACPGERGASAPWYVSDR